MLIDCDSCVMRPKACGDCVVTFLLSPAVSGGEERAATQNVPVELHSEEQQALEVLASSGLVPPLRLATVVGHTSDVPASEQNLLPSARRAG